jgi:hypothetical protein
MRCPYYVKINLDRHPFGPKRYCKGDPLVGLRVPSLFEETHYCTTLQYPPCRVFQTRQGYLEYEDIAETSQCAER